MRRLESGSHPSMSRHNWYRMIGIARNTDTHSVALSGVRNGEATSFAIIFASAGRRAIIGSAISLNTRSENGVSARAIAPSASNIFTPRERASRTPSSRLRPIRRALGSIWKSFTEGARWRRVHDRVC